ncbi:diphosphoinositol polyphosphate phosphohydrolase 1 [Galendromus occidentalis]|uniref:diphosphoinositol-polyphosphate diphosphatase n=1 Tax=Galendromus occidentalis TaxID=34638 RepID=A0AAJ6QTF6_9ACAR|nr:diphosphoinositol polyphosphate phosphohydrolase 1 [Galendromus occidentalis]
MKEKPNSTRTYDEEGFRRRAACLCVRTADETEILLVSSSSSPDRFIVPGGGLEPEEDAPAAAIREVMEEAGVKGTLGRCLGVFENLERRHRTQVFVLQVEDLLEEWDDSKSIGRKRKWFTVPNALEELTVSKPVQCNYVELLRKKDNKSGDGDSGSGGNVAVK